MNNILSRLFNALKYLLLVISFVLVLFGIMAMYKRLDKSMTEAIPLFIPFILVLIIYIVNIFIKSNIIRDNLLFNFTSVLLFVAIIIIGLRAKFDTNMLVYYKYGIEYNPLYLSDNLSTIKTCLYVLFGSNLLFLLSLFFEDKKVANSKKEQKKDKK